MDSATLARSLEHNRENQNIMWTRSLDLGARAAAWVLAGNAGALVLCFNALLDERVCDSFGLRVLGVVFVVGLAAAYFSVLCEQKSFGEFSAALATLVSKGTTAIGLIDKLGRLRALPQDDLNDEQINEAQSELDVVSAAIDGVDPAPKAATDLMEASNKLLTVATIALAGGALGAIWFLPTTALCP